MLKYETERRIARANQDIPCGDHKVLSGVYGREAQKERHLISGCQHFSVSAFPSRNTFKAMVLRRQYG